MLAVARTMLRLSVQPGNWSAKRSWAHVQARTLDPPTARMCCLAQNEASWAHSRMHDKLAIIGEDVRAACWHTSIYSFACSW